MKKQLFLLTVLLLSCMAKADDAVANVTPENIKPESVISETVKPENVAPATENVTGENVATPDVTKSEAITAEKTQDIKVAEIIQANIEGVTENCDTVFLNFKISKNKDNHNKQAWTDIIRATAVLIAAAEMHKNCDSNGDKIEEINKILNKSYEFLSNTTKLTGEANGVYGGYSIHLDIPKEYAQTIFPNSNQDVNK